MEEINKEQKILINEIKLYRKKLYKLNNKWNKNVKKKQNLCDHQWVTIRNMYERDVHCNKCGLTDWDKSKF